MGYPDDRVKVRRIPPQPLSNPGRMFPKQTLMLLIQSWPFGNRHLAALPALGAFAPVMPTKWGISPITRARHLLSRDDALRRDLQRDRLLHLSQTAEVAAIQKKFGLPGVADLHAKLLLALPGIDFSAPKNEIR